MRIECDIEGFDPQPILFSFFDSVMKDAAKRIALDPDAVDRVIIVSPDRFGKAVDSIRSGAIYTNTMTAVAAGKTIARRNAAGRIVSDIVLQRCLFESIAEALTLFQSPGDWDIHQQEALYVICHEFGHVSDYLSRNDDFEVPDPRSRPFSIKKTAHFYGNIVLTEYAACRNSSSVMTDSLFVHELNEAANRMSACSRHVNYFLDNPDGLTPRALAHTACQDAWFIMVELAKLYGHAMGNAERDASVSMIEVSLLKHEPLGAALTRIGNSYPNWNVPNLVAQLTTIWHRYSEISNVRFAVQDNDADLMVPV